MATKVASEPKKTKKKAAASSPAARKASSKKASTKKAAAKKAAAKKPVARKWESRAVTRLIEAGSMTECEHCEERVKFRARHRDMQVICNVYTKGVWTRVEHYHEDCYVKASEPFGPAED
ncbi:MAG: hypothetical protein ACN4GZ_09270 [Acidimicrobiales bacterium]